MKILVDFVRAEQHWDPDDGVQTNFLVFDFGGKRHQILCEESDIINAVRESKVRIEAAKHDDGLAQHAAALSRVEDDDSEPYGDPVVQSQRQINEAIPEQEFESEFSGDVPVHSPFVNVEVPEDEPAPSTPIRADAQRRQNIADTMASRPRTRAKLHQAKLDRLRQAAQAPMQLKVEVDDAGNPIMRPKAVPRVVANAQVRVERQMDGAQDLGDLVPDDDAFRQG